LNRAALEIRYTTDGSAPTIDSAKYQSPLNVTATMTVRATVFCEGQPLVTSTGIFTKGLRPDRQYRGVRGGDMGAAEDPTQVKPNAPKKKLSVSPSKANQ